jgi:hypothetical protein
MADNRPITPYGGRAQSFEELIELELQQQEAKSKTRGAASPANLPSSLQTVALPLSELYGQFIFVFQNDILYHHYVCTRLRKKNIERGRQARATEVAVIDEGALGAPRRTGGRPPPAASSLYRDEPDLDDINLAPMRFSPHPWQQQQQQQQQLDCDRERVSFSPHPTREYYNPYEEDDYLHGIPADATDGPDHDYDDAHLFALADATAAEYDQFDQQIVTPSTSPPTTLAWSRHGAHPLTPVVETEEEHRPPRPSPSPLPPSPGLLAATIGYPPNSS